MVKLLMIYGVGLFAWRAWICATEHDPAVAQKQIGKTDKITHITEEKTDGLDVVYLTFTPDEADATIEKIQKEREIEEQRRRMNVYSAGYFRRTGRIPWGGWSWTYYSERILPGHGLRIPGRHTDEQGYVRDENGYLCLASDRLRKGTVIETPFGSFGRVYDCGCGMHTIDVYVNW